MKPYSVRVPDTDAKRIEDALKSGDYLNGADFLRAAIRAELAKRVKVEGKE